jgi:hypothetical protein
MTLPFLDDLSPNVIAALVGAGATLIAAMINLRIAWRREVLDRLNAPRRKDGARRGLLFAIVILVLASGVGGYAAALYLMQQEQFQTRTLRTDLQQKIGQIQATALRLEEARLGERAAIEAELRLREDRRRGDEGTGAALRLAPCSKVVAVAAAPADGEKNEKPQSSTCSEADAHPIALCAFVPARSTVYEVAPYARYEGDTAPWHERRIALGGAIEAPVAPRGKRRSGKVGALPAERAESDTTKQVCVDVWTWDSERTLDVRLVVRYMMQEGGQTLTAPSPAAPGPAPAKPAPLNAAAVPAQNPAALNAAVLPAQKPTAESPAVQNPPAQAPPALSPTALNPAALTPIAAPTP